MKKLITVLSLAVIILSPTAHAETSEDVNGNTDLGCNGYTLIVEGKGRGTLTVSNPNTYIFLFKSFSTSDFEDTGTVKWDNNFYVYIHTYGVDKKISFTRLNLLDESSEGTIKFTGHSLVAVFGSRDDVKVSGNYHVKNSGPTDVCDALL